MVCGREIPDDVARKLTAAVGRGDDASLFSESRPERAPFKRGQQHLATGGPQQQIATKRRKPSDDFSDGPPPRRSGRKRTAPTRPGQDSATASDDDDDDDQGPASPSAQ